jgi:hypothetical protein
MKDSDLIRCSRSFRDGMLGRRESDRCCFLVCAALQGLLNAHGVDTLLVQQDFGNTNHVWLQLRDGRILDPTMDQFSARAGKALPKVYLGLLPDFFEEWIREARAQGRRAVPKRKPRRARKGRKS